jgi:hypothetical protein
MSFVKDEDILNATDGGLIIILSYYPNAHKVVDKSARQFKIRDSEKTASASLKKLQNGVWVVTDFGGDQKSRNAIQVCALEEGIDYGKACALLGARYNIKGAEFQLVKPIIEKRPLRPDEVPGKFSFEYHENFTKKELALLGPRVNAEHCEDFNLKSCKTFTMYKENEAVVTTSTEEYPIFVFDFGDWQKIYQPNSFEKQYRFRYAGTKPSKHVFGFDLIEKEFKKVKIAQQEEDEEDQYSIVDETENTKEKKKKKDPRLESAFIISGGSDGINLRSIGKFPIWFNSESEHLDWDEYKKLKIYVRDIYYVADLDSTGIKQAIALGLKFLDIKLLWLPEKLKEYRDKRGNPCKDFKDYVDKFYRSESSGAFMAGFEKLMVNALTMQFWTEWKTANGKMNFNLSNTRLYHFLTNMGFGRYESENLKEGFLYIRKEGSIIRVLHPYQIENYVHGFLENRQLSPDLRDYVYKSPQLGERSMSKLPSLNIDFSDADKDCQYWFFPKKVWKITAEGVTEFKQGEVDRYVWEDKIIDFSIKKEDPHFEIKKDVDGDLDIIIHKKDNMFLNYLINTSRVHWRKEIEESFEGKPSKEAEEYFKENQFNIAGELLTPDEILEQKQHLINKIYSIGYLLHKYKDESKAWCVFAMDNKISENGESHGGSGKSLAYGFLNNILKRRFYLKGRDEKLTQNDFIYHGVTEDTDYIFIDDASQYLKFDFFFSEITGSLKVNPKNSQPFEIPFSKAPKFAITSNFTIRDVDPSTARRLLYSVFSDWYHYNSNDEYKEVRQVSDDFGGRNLFRDFTETEWNAYYNLCAQCIQFFLSHAQKINPPMDNVTKRSLRAEMGDAFEGWAQAFFDEKEDYEIDPMTHGSRSKYLDQYFSKEMAFEAFKKATSQNKWLVTKFKKAMKAYCQLNGYIFNPKDLQNSPGRIVQKIDGRSQEAIFIRTVETPKEFKEETDVKEFENEEDIFN